MKGLISMTYLILFILLILIVILTYLLINTSKKETDTNNQTITIKVFSCEQIKVFEEESSIFDTSIYPPNIYADKDGYYYGIEKHSADRKLYICKPKEWAEFVNSVLDELTNLSYPDFLKAVLERLPEE